MIIRVSKDSTLYTKIARACMYDRQLSWKARGLLAYLLCHCDTWEVRTEDLMQASAHDERTSVQTGLAELVRYGYAKLETLRNAKGHVQGKQYIVAEAPIFLEHRQTENPTDGKTDSRETCQSVITEEQENRQTENLLVGEHRQTENPTDGKPAHVLISEGEEISKDLPSPPTEDLPTPNKRRGKQPYPVFSAGFLQVWEAYPHHRYSSKPGCYKKWVEHNLEPRTAEIVEKIERLKITRWRDGEFIPYTMTYFNQERWNADLEPLPSPVIQIRRLSRDEQRAINDERSNRELEEVALGINGHNSIWAPPKRHGKDLQPDVGYGREGRLLGGGR